MKEICIQLISLPNSRISCHGGITIVTSAVEETPPFYLRSASDGGVILHLARIKFTDKSEVTLDLNGVSSSKINVLICWHFAFTNVKYIEFEFLKKVLPPSSGSSMKQMVILAG
jgi:hypothetical protein